MPTATKSAKTAEQLRAELSALALDAVDGDEVAAANIEGVYQQVMALEAADARATVLESLATQEAARRVAEAAAHAEAELRVNQLALLEELGANRTALRKKADILTDQLGVALQELVELAARQRSLRRGLHGAQNIGLTAQCLEAEIVLAMLRASVPSLRGDLGITRSTFGQRMVDLPM
jgi:hypothetical protein